MNIFAHHTIEHTVGMQMPFGLIIVSVIAFVVVGYAIRRRG